MFWFVFTLIRPTFMFFFYVLVWIFICIVFVRRFFSLFLHSSIFLLCTHTIARITHHHCVMHNKNHYNSVGSEWMRMRESKREEREKFPSVELSKTHVQFHVVGKCEMNGHERERDDWIMRAIDKFWTFCIDCALGGVYLYACVSIEWVCCVSDTHRNDQVEPYWTFFSFRFVWIMFAYCSAHRLKHLHKAKTCQLESLPNE